MRRPPWRVLPPLAASRRRSAAIPLFKYFLASLMEMVLFDAFGETVFSLFCDDISVKNLAFPRIRHETEVDGSCSMVSTESE